MIGRIMKAKAKGKDWLFDFPAIPIYDNTSPYQQEVPFQFSLHIQQNKDGPVDLIELLHTEPADPRPDFAQALIEKCELNGSIVVYNMQALITSNNFSSKTLLF
jgi:hypothetical protein